MERESEMNRTPSLCGKYIVYGAGNTGRIIADIMGARIACFLDKDRSKWGRLCAGHEIMSLSRAFQKYGDTEVIVAVSDESQIRQISRELADEGYNCIHDHKKIFWDNAEYFINSDDWNGRTKGYDYSIILLSMRKIMNNRDEWIYHLYTWRDYTSRYLLKGISVFVDKYAHTGAKIADFGAGYGFWSLFFVNAVPDGSVTAIDKDKVRLEVLKRLSQKNREMRVIDADIRDVKPLQDKTIDMSFCANTLHVVKGWQDAVRQMCRTTKQGGYIILIATNPDSEGVRYNFRNSTALQMDCTLENINRTVRGKFIDKIDINMDGDTVPSYYILVYEVE